jgi:xylulokinase
MNRLILTFDVGTTGLKTCLYAFENQPRLVAFAGSEYRLRIGDSGEAEQDAGQWWDALRDSTGRVLENAGLKDPRIHGIAFSSQMQGLVLVDDAGRALRPAMSYMDQRAGRIKEKVMGRGPGIAGVRLDLLVRGLRVNGGVPASVKDPIWKYLWVKENEPDVFSSIRYWLDVKEYLIFRMTGKAVMTTDSAFATFLYDTRPGREGWDKKLIRKYGVCGEHLPPVVPASQVAGSLMKSSAMDLGLPAGISVMASGGDASLIGIGAGSVRSGDTHVYTGTSGWVSTLVKKRTLDLSAMIASVPAVRQGYFNYFAEQETAGKCLEWVKDHLALDEIHLFLNDKTIVDEPEAVHDSLYDFLVQSISTVPPGADGVLFTPWLHGNRSPFEDPYARGMFFNLSLESGKRTMIRAVIEGIMFNQRWLLDSIERKISTNPTIRFVGGGAVNPFLGQMLSDILHRPVEIPEHPRLAGATGAAVVAAKGLGWIDSYEQVGEKIPIAHRFRPYEGYKSHYDKNYIVFKRLYRDNKKNYYRLNRISKKTAHI